jgi:hypothetical protein
MPVINHIHTLRRIRSQKSSNLLTKKRVGTTFQCADPKCTWKQPVNFIEGKEFACIYCGQPYIFTPSMKRMRFPHCRECTSPRHPKSPKKETTPLIPLSDKEQDTILERLLKFGTSAGDS